MARAEKQAKQRSSMDNGDGSPQDQASVSLDAMLAFLAERPDVAALLAEHPGLTVEAVQAALGQAAAMAAGIKTVQRRKGAHQTEFVRTHGLPEPDGSLHKGNVFRAILAPFKPGKLLDLGAGKGNFAISAAHLGWQVTAVDARTVRWPEPDDERDPETANLIRSITWIQSDVREFPIERGEYDFICILGLLHHLEVPDQIALLRRCAGTPLLIDTRIATANTDKEGPYEGIVIREHGETREERDLVPTAAWGNATSFRHTEESLLRLARDAGYPLVLMARPPHRRDYTFYLCLPRNTDAPGEGGKGRARRLAARDGAAFAGLESPPESSEPAETAEAE